jgi:hypothetical protein
VSAEIEALFEARVTDLARRRGYTALGRLAAWWLRDDALRALGKDVSAVNDLRPDEFVVLLMRSRPSDTVHEGLALPLCWKPTRKKDPRLPRRLAELADRIEGAPRAAADKHGDFRLYLGDDCPDLSEIDIASESAGAMLAATLESARLSAELDATVTATASWGATDLGPIDGLSAKVAAARRLGLTRVFVSRFQYPIDAADAELVARLEGKNATEQVHALLLALDAPPAKGSFDARCEWYHRHARSASSRARAQSFFCSSLAAELAERDRLGRHEPLARPDRLVVIASGRAESAVFAACLHRPTELMVLHESSAQGEGFAAQTRAALLSCGIAARLELRAMARPEAGFDAFLHSARQHLSASAADSSRATHVDLTGGTSLMKLALGEAARDLGVRRFVVDQREHAKGGTTEVTTLRGIELPHGAAGLSRKIS